MLFDLFRRLVLQLPDGGASQEDAPSLLSVLPLLGTEIARLAAGGVAVGLVAGALTRRLLRLLRWYGASTSQVGLPLLDLLFIGVGSRDAAAWPAVCVCQQWAPAGWPLLRLALAFRRLSTAACHPGPASVTTAAWLQEVAAILAGGYLAFYTANSPLHVSGKLGARLGRRAAHPFRQAGASAWVVGQLHMFFSA